MAEARGRLPDYAAAGPFPVCGERAEWADPDRARTLPLRLYLPVGAGGCPAVLFSPGLGGSRDGGEHWLGHWASWGIAGIAVQHPGSDERVFAGRPRMALRQILRQAMTPAQLAERARDLSFVIDRLAAGRLAGLDANRIGVAGHSFGAVTVQALAGERLTALATDLADARPRAWIALSPSARGDTTAEALAARFAGVVRPFFSITGSRDDGIGRGDIAAGNRCLPFAHMPGPDKYLLVLDGAGHPAFAGHVGGAEAFLPAGKAPPRRDVASLVRAASTAFWRQHLAGDLGAGNWLRREFAAGLAAGDRFTGQ